MFYSCTRNINVQDHMGVYHRTPFIQSTFFFLSIYQFTYMTSPLQGSFILAAKHRLFMKMIVSMDCPYYIQSTQEYCPVNLVIGCYRISPLTFETYVLITISIN